MSLFVLLCASLCFFVPVPIVLPSARLSLLLPLPPPTIQILPTTLLLPYRHLFPFPFPFPSFLYYNRFSHSSLKKTKMSRSGPSIPIPRTVPVLPLHDKVLLPGVVTRMQITRRDSIPLFEHILRTFDSRELSKCIIGAFPVRPPPTTTTTLSTTAPTQQSSADNKSDTKKPGVLPHGELIIPGPSPLLPNPRSSNGKDERALVSLRASSSVNPAHIHSTGCAARLVRLERAVGGFTVVLEGTYLCACLCLFACTSEQMEEKGD